MLSWACDLGPTSIPLAPRWLALPGVKGSEFTASLAQITSRYENLLAGKTSGCSTPTETVSLRALSGELCSAIRAETGALAALNKLLREPKYGDFLSACVFDFDNLISQWQRLEAVTPNDDLVIDPVLLQVTYPVINHDALSEIYATLPMIEWYSSSF